MIKMIGRLMSRFRRHSSESYRVQVARNATEAAGPAFINLGIDFGTSFTKACFRDTGVNHSGVIKFDCAEHSLAIIPSLVAIGENGELYMGHRAPAQASVVRFLKMRLAGLTVDKDEISTVGVELGSELVCRSLSAWYLANVLKEAQAYVLRTEAERVRGRQIRWSANAGVPVEHCDSPVLEVFEEVLGVAWRWASVDTLPTTTTELLNQYREIARDCEHQTCEFVPVPEIAAAIRSFVISREAVPDFYVYFDIGGGTVDGVAFKFFFLDGERRVHFYSGRVEPIGVSVLEAFGVGFATSGLIGPRSHEVHSEFMARLQSLVGDVIMTARKKDGRNWQREPIQRQQERPSWMHLAERQMKPLVFFLGGYGACIDWYQHVIQSTYKDFNQQNAGIPPYRLERVPLPPDLDMCDLPKAEFMRFAIAYGLSVPEHEGPTILLPSQVRAVEPAPPQRSSEVVPYADSKDAYD